MKKVVSVLAVLVYLFVFVSTVSAWTNDGPPSTWKNTDVVYSRDDGYLYPVCTELDEEKECSHWLQFGEFISAYHELNQKQETESKYRRTTWKRVAEDKYIMRTEFIDVMKDTHSNLKVLLKHLKFSDGTYGVKVSRIVADDSVDMGMSYIEDFLFKVGEHIE